jgi:diacylglycerol kinase (ATP)
LSAGRVVRAFTYSLKGLTAAWRDEPAFRQECGLLAVLVPLTLWLQLPLLQTVFLLGLMMAVLVVELLNSGLEALVDMTSPEFHALAGKAKDCGSAAVLLAMVALMGSWIVLAGPALWRIAVH